MPVLMNIFANEELTRKILGDDPDMVGERIEGLMKLKPPRTWREKLLMLPRLFALKNIFPKRLSSRGECQEIEIGAEEIDLDRLPILKTWPLDGGRFITMGQVYTISIDGSTQNLGMYRLQQYGKNRLGMHWQIHKDASHFFDQYRDAGRKMPVTIAIGGDLSISGADRRPCHTVCSSFYSTVSSEGRVRSWSNLSRTIYIYPKMWISS